jgi:hypothetical protein
MTAIPLTWRTDTLHGDDPVGFSGGLRVGPAVYADHHAIHQLLLQVLQRPTVKEFQSQLDQPGYEPGQRLLIRNDGRLVAHLRIIPRRLHFGGLIVPAACVADLAVLPEFCARRCATMLLGMAGNRILCQGGVLGYLRTRNPAFYGSQGWVDLGTAPHWSASPQSVLIQLRERTPAALNQPKRNGLNLHEYRCYEQDGLERLYTLHGLQAFGSPRRTYRDWYWLIARRAFDRLYVALRGPAKLDLEQIPAAVAGYAIGSRSRLIELITDTRRPEVAETLLARFCADAIEQNRYQIRLDAPPDSPLAVYFLSDPSRGDKTRQPADGFERDEPVVMVRSFGHRLIARRLHGLLVQRWVRAGGDLPCELGFHVEGQPWLLRVTETQCDLLSEGSASRYVQCSSADLLRMLLGSLDIEAAVADRRIVADSPTALAAVQTLLPPVPLWLPPLDDLARQ